MKNCPCAPSVLLGVNIFGQKGKKSALVICSCIGNNHKIYGLKQYTFIISVSVSKESVLSVARFCVHSLSRLQTLVFTGMLSLEIRKEFTFKLQAEFLSLKLKDLRSLFSCSLLTESTQYLKDFIVSCSLAFSHNRATFSEATKRIFLSHMLNLSRIHF